jgi:hypothetical protein
MEAEYIGEPNLDSGVACHRSLNHPAFCFQADDMNLLEKCGSF